MSPPLRRRRITRLISDHQRWHAHIAAAGADMTLLILEKDTSWSRTVQKRETMAM